MSRHVFDTWLARLSLRRRVLALISAQGIRAYLVGGTVRDALLGRESCDLDIAVEGTALALARQLANQLRGAYVALDVERDVGRIVVRAGGGQQHIDVAALRSGSIEADLWARDYTVNAMAVPLEDDLGELLDPTGGRADLDARLLRVVREDSFGDDPLRILRGVRLRGALGFSLTAETESLARRWLPQLRDVSPERVRDEFMQILALDDAAGSLSYAGALGVYDVVFPDLAGTSLATEVPWSEGVQVVAALESLFGDWHPPRIPFPGTSSSRASTGFPPVSARDSLMEGMIGQHLASLADHWAAELSYGRNRWPMLKLAALLSAIPAGPVLAAEVVRNLRFSVREVGFAAATLKSCARISSWGVEDEPGALAIYRTFRAFGADGVDGAILALAIQHAWPGTGVNSRSWSALMQRVARLLNAWFVDYDTLVNPPQLVSGREVIHALHLNPGPRVGELLERVREAQVQGLVHTHQEAMAYLHAQAANQLP